MGRVGRVRVSASGRCGRVGGLRGEVGAQGREVLTVGWTEEAIVTHLDQAFGQDVLQKTLGELGGGQRAELGLTGVGFVAEGDLVVLDLDDAAVAEGDAKDVGSKILEGRATVANRLAVNDPVLLPHVRRNVRKAISATQGVAELGAKEFGERLDREQEILASGQPRVTAFG